MNTKAPRQDIDEVIAGGFCIGCGVCAALRPSAFALDMTEEGMLQAHRVGAADDDPSRLCPMTGAGPDETAIARARFPDLPVHDRIGAYGTCGAGWVAADEFRRRGSSGGMLSWLAAELLTNDFVDEVWHVKPLPSSSDRLFAYHRSRTAAEVLEGSKSKYYPIDLSGVITQICAQEARFAVLGIPCFIKALNLAMDENNILRSRIHFLLGLICGHLKSAQFAELLAWQLDVAPDRLMKIDFRRKIPNRPAHAYGVEVVARDEPEKPIRAPMRGLMGRDWGQGFMRYPACDYCDDVVAECADVAVGDAWLPRFRYDWRGTSVFVVRNEQLAGLVENGVRRGALRVEALEPEDVAASQAGGFRDRRDALAWRLAKLDATGQWRPRKRVKPARDTISEARKNLIELRMMLTRRSHPAFARAKKAGRYELFVEEMRPLLQKYAEFTNEPVKTRMIKKIRNLGMLLTYRWRRHATFKKSGYH